VQALRLVRVVLRDALVRPAPEVRRLVLKMLGMTNLSVGKLHHFNVGQGVRAVRAVVSVVRDGVHVQATHVAGQRFAGSTLGGRQVAFCGLGLLLGIGPSHNYAAVIVSIVSLRTVCAAIVEGAGATAGRSCAGSRNR
jgi:hypothetical protein